MKLRIRKPQISLKVFVEVTVGRHDHNEIGQVSLSERDKALMLNELDTAPAIIQNKIQASRIVSNSLPLPKIRQITNFKYRGKREKSILTVEDLRKYAMAKSAIPDNENQAFVVDFASEIEDEKEMFCLVLSTPRLQNLQRASMSLQADATYKLTWHGFPLLVCGFSDAKHKFFGTFIALCSNENKWSYEHFFRAISKNHYEAKVLMADGDKTISSAAKSVWPNIDRAMCYAHVTFNLNKKLSKRPKEIANMIRSDVALLQESSSREEFENAALLLNTEWENRFANKPEVQDICRYFFRQWVNSSLCGWYEGYSLYAATNNGLESRNAFLKKITFRQKLGLTDFLHMAENTIANWSIRPEDQIPCQEPEIGPAVYREAYLLKLRNPLCKKVTGQDIYVLTLQELSENEMLQMYSELAENTFACWQRYKQIRASIMIIKKSNVWPSMYMCSCSTGRKKRVCEHSVLLMCKLKILVYPPDASAKPLSRKRKLGRPKLAGRALSRE